MNGLPTHTIALSLGQTIRVILPDGSGMVDIETGLITHPDRNPRHRVDVISDQPRYGRIARDGRTYVVENQDPGVVFLTGHQPDREPANP